MNALKRTGLMALVFAAACPNNTPTAAPSIDVFAAAPATIQAGNNATLIWGVSGNVTSLTLAPGGDVTGKKQIVVTPTATTAYTLTATGPGGTVTANTTVTVNPAPGPAAPTIDVFAAGPSAIQTGGSATLVWGVSGTVTSLALSPGGDVTGKTQVVVNPSATTTYTLTATGPGGTATATATVTVTVSIPSGAVGLKLTAPASVTAGAATSVTVTAVDAAGVTVTSYQGTVHFSADDPGAVLPSDIVFGTAQAGVATAPVTFKTAGPRTLVVKDISVALAGFANVTVNPAAASVLGLSALPASAAAGGALTITVRLSDAYGNAATAYAGKVTFTSSDTTAALPAPYTFVSGDAGAHAFALSFFKAGSQTVTVIDNSSVPLTATSGTVAVGPGPAAAYQAQLSSGANVMAGVSATLSLTVVDAYGNVVTGYSNAVDLTSSDALFSPGTAPTWSGGHASTTVSLATLGPQTVTATEHGGTITGTTAAVNVHGFFYRAPNSPSALLSLVPGASFNAAVAVLDLVANAALTGYSAGMDLPLDTTQAGSPVIVKGALDPGTSPVAMAATFGSGKLANFLVSGVSQKAAGPGAVATDATLTGGATLYSLKLALSGSAKVGAVVFDGANLPPGFRAGLRDRAGNEIVHTWQVAVGRLEVR